ncbi:hypothetical protein [Candidatus Nitrosocosmicus franklandus]|uniref:hypothetical protein n=1 Tax=Candidatus Nitrosocosmicus franklandianus TaxID=1798806 RepID=UPI0015591D45|nr:hypothetical protein [Candidatus Nitrosocosmicus franklandus]
MQDISILMNDGYRYLSGGGTIPQEGEENLYHSDSSILEFFRLKSRRKKYPQ